MVVVSFADDGVVLARQRGDLLWSVDGSTGRADRRLRVTADDGVELHVEVYEAPGAAVTAVFCHGFLLDSTSWHVQRAALADTVRMVLWDHRGHGRSGWGSPPNATIDQLGRDLHAVLEATTPRGPVVLIGQSMGGMAILGLAEAHPELFGDRVKGVVLASTSAGKLAAVTAGFPVPVARVLHRVLPHTLGTLRRRARLVDAARRPMGGMSFLLTWPYLFGSRVPRPVARLTTQLMASVPIQVVADFYAEFLTHDKSATLPVLGRVPVLVMVGERDLITPLAHSQVLASAIPAAELVVIPGAGHLLILERPAEVNQHLQDFINQVTEAAPDGDAAPDPVTTTSPSLNLSDSRLSETKTWTGGRNPQYNERAMKKDAE